MADNILVALIDLKRPFVVERDASALKLQPSYYRTLVGNLTGFIHQQDSKRGGAAQHSPRMGVFEGGLGGGQVQAVPGAYAVRNSHRPRFLEVDF